MVEATVMGMVEAPMTAAVLGVEKAAMAAAVMGVEKAGRGDQNPSPTQKLYFVKAVSMAPFWWMNNFIYPPHQKKRPPPPAVHIATATGVDSSVRRAAGRHATSSQGSRLNGTTEDACQR